MWCRPANRIACRRRKKLIYSAIKTELSSPQSVVTRIFVFSYHFTSSCAFIYLFASILNISSHNIRSLIYFFFVSYCLPASHSMHCNAMDESFFFKVWTCEQFECAITKRWISINFNWARVQKYLFLVASMFIEFFTHHTCSWWCVLKSRANVLQV